MGNSPMMAYLRNGISSINVYEIFKKPNIYNPAMLV